jgi:AraC-like DNA-binding protein
MSFDQNSLNQIPDIRIAAEERYSKNGYFWDNRIRKDQGVILQQTLQGSAFYETPTGRTLVEPGMAMLYRHGEESWYGSDERCRQPYRLRWVEITHGHGVAGLFEQIRSEFGSVLRMSEQGEAGQLMRRLVEEVRSGHRRDRLMYAETGYRLLLSVYREQIAGQQGDDPISFGRSLLETQFRSPRNLKEWAEEIGVSREHFTREFSARYGETPAVFLRRLRLEHADSLIRGHHLSLADVAFASGFASEQTFYRAYRQHFGVPAGRARSDG